MVLFAAIPKAKERTTTAKKPGFFRKVRAAYCTSDQRISNGESVSMFVVPRWQKLIKDRDTSGPLPGTPCGFLHRGGHPPLDTCPPFGGYINRQSSREK